VINGREKEEEMEVVFGLGRVIPSYFPTMLAMVGMKILNMD